MISLYSLFSSTMTAIRDTGGETAPEDVAAVGDGELGDGPGDERVVAEPPPHPATANTRSVSATVHVTP